MQERAITIILGAGASAAYDCHHYPSLSNLLARMLKDARVAFREVPKQSLYLAYALRTALGLDGPSLEGSVRRALIRNELTRITRSKRNTRALKLDNAFAKLESPGSGATRAYWALTYAIGIYMYRIMELNIRRTNAAAHTKLLGVIDELVSNGVIVNVVDFNWDCLLEQIWWHRSTKYTFGWNCKRTRIVIEGAGGEQTLSELARCRHFRRCPQDEQTHTRNKRVLLIKPHGDRCTFLRGDREVFYCGGGRHGQTDVGLFPKRLDDIGADDNFVRSSIMPPTRSRFRHEHSFYREELDGFKSALADSDTVVIIGWSARGADGFYRPLFREVFKEVSQAPWICLVDLSKDKKPDARLEARVRQLFGHSVHMSTWWRGFTEEAVAWLRGHFPTR